MPSVRIPSANNPNTVVSRGLERAGWMGLGREAGKGGMMIRYSDWTPDDL